MPGSACVKNSVHYPEMHIEIQITEEIQGMYPPEEIRGMYLPEEIQEMYPSEEIQEMYPPEEIQGMFHPEETRGMRDLPPEETTGIGTGHVICMVTLDRVIYVWFPIEVPQAVMVKGE